MLLALAEVIAGRNQVSLSNENQGIEGNETSRSKLTFSHLGFKSSSRVCVRHLTNTTPQFSQVV